MTGGAYKTRTLSFPPHCKEAWEGLGVNLQLLLIRITPDADREKAERSLLNLLAHLACMKQTYGEAAMRTLNEFIDKHIDDRGALGYYNDPNLLKNFFICLVTPVCGRAASDSGVTKGALYVYAVPRVKEVLGDTNTAIGKLWTASFNSFISHGPEQSEPSAALAAFLREQAPCFAQNAHQALLNRQQPQINQFAKEFLPANLLAAWRRVVSNVRALTAHATLLQELLEGTLLVRVDGVTTTFKESVDANVATLPAGQVRLVVTECYAPTSGAATHDDSWPEDGPRTWIELRFELYGYSTGRCSLVSLDAFNDSKSINSLCRNIYDMRAIWVAVEQVRGARERARCRALEVEVAEAQAQAQATTDAANSRNTRSRTASTTSGADAVAAARARPAAEAAADAAKRVDEQVARAIAAANIRCPKHSSNDRIDLLCACARLRASDDKSFLLPSYSIEGAAFNGSFAITDYGIGQWGPKVLGVGSCSDLALKVFNEANARTTRAMANGVKSLRIVFRMNCSVNDSGELDIEVHDFSFHAQVADQPALSLGNTFTAKFASANTAAARAAINAVQQMSAEPTSKRARARRDGLLHVAALALAQLVAADGDDGVPGVVAAFTTALQRGSPQTALVAALVADDRITRAAFTDVDPSLDSIRALDQWVANGRFTIASDAVTRAKDALRAAVEPYVLANPVLVREVLRVACPAVAHVLDKHDDAGVSLITAALTAALATRGSARRTRDGLLATLLGDERLKLDESVVRRFACMSTLPHAAVPDKAEYDEVEWSEFLETMRQRKHKRGTVYKLKQQLSSDRAVDNNRDRREKTPTKTDFETLARELGYRCLAVDTGKFFEFVVLPDGTVVLRSGNAKFSSRAMRTTYSRLRRLQFRHAVDDAVVRILAGKSDPHRTIVFVESSYPLKQTVLDSWVQRGLVVVFVSGVMTSQRCASCWDMLENVYDKAKDVAVCCGCATVCREAAAASGADAPAACYLVDGDNQIEMIDDAAAAVAAGGDDNSPPLTRAMTAAELAQLGRTATERKQMRHRVAIGSHLPKDGAPVNISRFRGGSALAALALDGAIGAGDEEGYDSAEDIELPVGVRGAGDDEGYDSAEDIEPPVGVRGAADDGYDSAEDVAAMYTGGVREQRQMRAFAATRTDGGTGGNLLGLQRLPTWQMPYEKMKMSEMAANKSRLASRDERQRRSRARRCNGCCEAAQRCETCLATAWLTDLPPCAVCKQPIVATAELAELAAAQALPSQAVEARREREALVQRQLARVHVARFDKVLNWRVKWCPRCKEHLNRDHNSAACVLAIAAAESKGEGRPRAFQYKKPVGGAANVAVADAAATTRSVRRRANK